MIRKLDIAYLLFFVTHIPIIFRMSRPDISYIISTISYRHTALYASFLTLANPLS
jgi:hypothetical protein